VAVADLPALAVAGVKHPGDHPRLGLADIVRRALGGAFGEQDRRSSRCLCSSRCVQRNVAGLHALGLLEDLVERGVERGEQLGVGAEVGRDPLDAVGQRTRLDAVIDGDVGATEAVDRLLGVPHHGQAAGARPQRPPVLPGLVVAREQQRELGLHGIGVLELVDQDRPEPAAEILARRPAVRQQIASPEQQIVEVRPTLSLALGLIAGDESLDMRQQTEQRSAP